MAAISRSADAVNLIFARWLSSDENTDRAGLMEAIGDKLTCRVILQEGDFDFAYSGYATYKWIDKDNWNPTSLYVYGLKLALIEFHEDGPIVTVINSPHAAQAFRKLFIVSWNMVCRDIPTRRKEFA